MKKLIVLLLTLICVPVLAACSANDIDNSKPQVEPNDDPIIGSENNDISAPLSTEVDTAYPYVIMEITEDYLLVAEIDEYGNAVEAKQYIVPNLFYPSNKIAVGDRIAINHNDMILETFPMQFGEIYSMEYHDEETNCSIVVTVD